MSGNRKGIKVNAWVPPRVYEMLKELSENGYKTMTEVLIVAITRLYFAERGKEGDNESGNE